MREFRGYDVCVAGRNPRDDNLHDYFTDNLGNAKKYCDIWELNYNIIRAYEVLRQGEWVSVNYNDWVDYVDLTEEEKKK